MNGKWYIVFLGDYTSVKKLERLKRALERHNVQYELFSPKIKVVDHLGNETQEDMFEGYVFVRIDPKDLPILARITNYQILPIVLDRKRKTRSEPLPIEDEIVENLKKEVVVVPSEYGRLKPGDFVRVHVMSMVFNGTFLSFAGKDLAVVLMQMFGREVRVVVSLENISLP